MRSLIITGAFMAFTTSFAGGADQFASEANQNPGDFKQYIFSTSMSTINDKLTNSSLTNLRMGEGFGLQYSPSPYLFVGGAIELYEHDSFGYKFNAGIELPGDYLTPYFDVVYNHNHETDMKASNRVTVDYAVGTTVSVPYGISFLVELKNPIKSDEAARFGVGYNFTTSVSTNVDYWMSLSDKSNGMDVELDYAFN